MKASGRTKNRAPIAITQSGKLELRRSFSPIAFNTCVVCVLATLLSSEYWRTVPVNNLVLGEWRVRIGGLFSHKDTQWLGMACLLLYLFAFIWLKLALNQRNAARMHGPRSHGLIEWLQQVPMLVVACIVVGTYSAAYAEAADSTDALTLIGCMMLGQSVAFWQCYRAGKGWPAEVISTILISLVLLLAVTSLWQPEMFRRFQYRDQARWSGAWNNPNTYGLLMGLGLVLSVGLIMESWMAARNQPTGQIMKLLGRGICCVAAAALTVGLIKSYSRGAWAGVVLGLAYMGWCMLRPMKQMFLLSKALPESELGKDAGHCVWLRRNAVTLAVVALAGFVLAFWTFRHGEQPIVRRAFSAGNWNDFSWRNRATTYTGALQMMADRPWFGYGWNQPPRLYRDFYQPHDLQEGGSFTLNDCVVIGTSVGLPCLALFLAYVWLSFAPSESLAVGNLPIAPTRAWLQTTCRAGVVVLAVGFFFSGGLFKLALAAPFWVLLELGRPEHGALKSAIGTSSPATVS